MADKETDILDLDATGTLRSLADMNNAWELVGKMIKSTAEFAADCVNEFLEAEQTTMRLETALRNAGAQTEDWSEKLQEQAHAYERVTGKSDEYIVQLQTMLLTMGVAPEQIERVTKAALNLAAATGQDATFAAKQLAMANAQGREELKRYGIVVEEGTDVTHGFENVLKQVEERFGNLNETIPPQTRQLNEVKGAWNDLKEAIGQTVAEGMKFSNASDLIVRALDSITKTLRGPKTEETAGGGILAMIEADEKADRPAPRELPRVSVDVDARSDAAKKKAAEDYKKQQQALRDHLVEMNALSDESASNLLKQDQEWAAASFDWEAARQEQELTEAKAHAADMMEIVKSEEAARQAIRDKEVAEEKQFWEKLGNEAKGFYEKFASFGTQFISDLLMQNTKFNAAFKEANLERRQIELEEMGIHKDVVQIKKELAEEEAAAQQKKTADFLMSIAKEAGVKALMAGADAVAALAQENYAGAAKYGIAAALYGGVAVATGAAAVAINSSRGMTGEERSQVESLQQSNAERRKRMLDAEAQTTASAGQDVRVQQNVYFLGISAMSEVEQAARLEEIRKKYLALSTGH